MKKYLVGGAVRDHLLGRPVSDQDFVVVGATEQQMLDRGYTKVGASFPVFLHPSTGEEYALARTERKTGVGYNGFDVVFDPSVTLEDDLIRRDLTINAMAYDLETGELIDPYGGRSDLNAGILRHTSPAFAEDPIRVLRTARFAARYKFNIAEETMNLMRKVAPELMYVPQERVFAEIHKGLTEKHPLLMFSALEKCGALEVECMAPYSEYDAMALNQCYHLTPSTVKFVFASAGFVDEDYVQCCVPTEYARMSRAYHKYANQLINYERLSSAQRVQLLTEMRAFSDMAALEHTFKALAVTDDAEAAWIVYDDLAKLKEVDTASIARPATGAGIREAVFNARVAALS